MSVYPFTCCAWEFFVCLHRWLVSCQSWVPCVDGQPRWVSWRGFQAECRQHRTPSSLPRSWGWRMGLLRWLGNRWRPVTGRSCPGTEDVHFYGIQMRLQGESDTQARSSWCHLDTLQRWLHRDICWSDCKLCRSFQDWRQVSTSTFLLLCEAVHSGTICGKAV